MSDKRVVLGIAYSQGMDLGEKIAGELEERGLGDVECVLAHTKSAVETLLGRDSSIVGAILLRDISVSSPYTAKEIVMLSESYPDVVFVPVCIESYKGSGFAQELLDGGVYNMVFNSDSDLGTLTGRIIKPYGRREARRYYGLIGESERKTERVSERSGLTDENYYSYLEFLQEGEGKFSDKLNYIKGLLDSATFKALLLRVPEELKDKVSCEAGYENFYSEEVTEKKVSVKKRVKRERGPEPEKTEKPDGKRIFIKAADICASVLSEIGSGLKAVLDADDEGEVKGFRKFLVRTKKEFASLEQSLNDELSVEEKTGNVVPPKADAEVVKSVPAKVSEVVVLDEPDEAVTLSDMEIPKEEAEELPKEPAVLTEVVVLNETLEETILPVVEVRISDSTGDELNETAGQLERTEKSPKKVREKKVRGKQKKEEKVKQVYIGSVVIAVSSVKKGIGCSHVARAFANYMYRIEKRSTCFIDCEKALYAAPEGLLSGIDVLSFAELSIAYNRYDCIVMDIGTDYKKFNQEIVRATVKVMCSTADDAVIESLYRFMRQDAEPGAWIYAFNHVLTRAKEKRIEELLEDYKYILIPACDEEDLSKSFIKDIKHVLSGKRGR